MMSSLIRPFARSSASLFAASATSVCAPSSSSIIGSSSSSISSSSSRCNSQYTAKRSLIIYIPAYADLKEELTDFGHSMDNAGLDDFPFFRREHWKRKAKRYHINTRKQGKVSNRKVRGIVQFIEYKRENNFR